MLKKQTPKHELYTNTKKKHTNTTKQTTIHTIYDTLLKTNNPKHIYVTNTMIDH
jgi:hypothetical protein